MELKQECAITNMTIMLDEFKELRKMIEYDRNF